jgi:hypothetical protein
MGIPASHAGEYSMNSGTSSLEASDPNQHVMAREQRSVMDHPPIIAHSLPTLGGRWQAYQASNGIQSRFHGVAEATEIVFPYLILSGLHILRVDQFRQMLNRGLDHLTQDVHREIDLVLARNVPINLGTIKCSAWSTNP